MTVAPKNDCVNNAVKATATATTATATATVMRK